MWIVIGASVPVVVAQQQRREAADAVARHLGAAAVGVEQPHRRAVRRRLVEDQAVGADAGVPLAQLARERVERDAGADVAASRT